ncbi:MAG: hypothetical protein OSJ45_06585 [Lachnospiraceae bacterium]|nr:hypothetical protein [Lachnospiraceae bacterium]
MWCPVCKTEYQEGITACPECGSALEEGTEEDFVTESLCSLKDKDEAKKLLEYLHFSGIKKAEEQEEEGAYVITVPQSQAKQAEKLMRGFMMALQEEQDKTEDTAGDKNKDAETRTYTKKADEYKDVKNSGITFIIFGFIGIAYLILCWLGIIPLTYNEIVLVLLLCMFVFFVAGGFKSVIKSQKIKGQIAEEENLTNELKLWLDENITSGLVKSWKDNSVTDEENELIVISKISSTLSDAYKQLDVSYIEMVADEYFNEKLSGNI